MEDDRSTYSSPLYGDDGGFTPEAGLAAPTGFTRHQSSNARRMTARKPLLREREPQASAEPKESLLQRSLGRLTAASRPQRGEPRRASAADGDDYLGAGPACRMCGSPVDETQDRCPHCGAFVRPPYTSVAFWVAVAAGVVLVVLLTVAITSCRGGDAKEPTVETPATGDDVVAVGGSTTTDGDTGTGVGTVTTGDSGKDTLQYALSNAQYILDASSTNHSYTYNSLRNLQSVVDAAQAVYNSSTATADDIAGAAQSVSDALNSTLVTVLDTSAYPLPYYSDLLDSYVGQQVGATGTITSITVGDDGITTVVFDKDGYDGYSVYAQCYSWMLADNAAVGMQFEVYGTDTGNIDGCPVIFADTVASW